MTLIGVAVATCSASSRCRRRPVRPPARRRRCAFLQAGVVHLHGRGRHRDPRSAGPPAAGRRRVRDRLARLRRHPQDARRPKGSDYLRCEFDGSPEPDCRGYAAMSGSLLRSAAWSWSAPSGAGRAANSSASRRSRAAAATSSSSCAAADRGSGRAATPRPLHPPVADGADARPIKNPSQTKGASTSWEWRARDQPGAAARRRPARPPGDDAVVRCRRRQADWRRTIRKAKGSSSCRGRFSSPRSRC